MNPQLLFWVPAALRALLFAIAAGVVWWIAGVEAALLLAFVGIALLAFTQLHYLYRLNTWLDNPDQEKLPDGWGAWTDIFARLYRLRRDDEKNQTELTEWLARFRQAMHLLPDG